MDEREKNDEKQRKKMSIFVFFQILEKKFDKKVKF